MAAPLPRKSALGYPHISLYLPISQANVPFFSELRANLIALHAALDTPALRGLNKALLALVKEESGVAAPALRRYP